MTDPQHPTHCPKCGNPMTLERVERRLNARDDTPHSPHRGYYELTWCRRCGHVVEPAIPPEPRRQE